jgi:hypothetical protein
MKCGLYITAGITLRITGSLKLPHPAKDAFGKVPSRR